MKELINVKQLMEYTGYSRRSIYQMVFQKKIPCRQAVKGGKLLFDVEEINEWLKSKK